MALGGAEIVAAVTAVVGFSSGVIALYQRANAYELRLLIEQTRSTIVEQITGTYMRRSDCPFREETVHSLLLLLRKDAKDTDGED